MTTTTDPTTTAEPTTTPDPTTTTTTTDPPTTTTTVPSLRLVYSEDWRLSSTNLDVTPPEHGNGSFWVDYLPGIGSPQPAISDLYAASLSSVAERREGRPRNAEDCADAVRRYGTSKVTLSRGGSYCVVTRQGTVGAITDVRFTNDGAYGLLTVWSTEP
ncbi:hypothetical protein ACFQV2_07390 [Actinokineospora soli]|uniref:Serine/threonine protein kinase n=1 Tax=Actinokineospora soli TaxID=1048753 RepID=A0ABW2TJY7_9PSEU